MPGSGLFHEPNSLRDERGRLYLRRISNPFRLKYLMNKTRQGATVEGNQ
jgi:hypothetical protein